MHRLVFSSETNRTRPKAILNHMMMMYIAAPMCLLLSCSSGPELPMTTTGARQQFPKLHFSIVFPADWLLFYADNSSDVEVWNVRTGESNVSPEGITITATVDESPLAPPDSPDCEYLEISAETAARCLSYDDSSVSESEIAWVEYLLSFRGPDDQKREFLNYRIRCRTTSENLDEYRDVFDRVVESFRLESD